jgi:hypothetical protein
MDTEWVERNGDYVRSSMARNRQAIEEIGRCIWEAPDDGITLEMLLTWMEERARAGFEIIIIDPITAATVAKQPWIEDLKFLTKAKMISRRHGCRFIFVTHPRTGTKGAKATHNDIAGGAAYPRFSHTVIWVERNDTDSQFLVKSSQDHPPEFIVPNRIVSIPKARNGPGAGKKIAFNFNSRTLQFEEYGFITREMPQSE